MRSIKRLAEGTGETFYYLGNILYESYSIDATGIESSLPQKEYVQQAMDLPLVLFQDVDENATTGTLDGREAYFYHTNPRGDVYALSNEAGDIVERYDYSLYGEVQVLDPFHNPVAGNVSQFGNPFLFGAVYFDNETKFKSNFSRHWTMFFCCIKFTFFHYNATDFYTRFFPIFSKGKSCRMIENFFCLKLKKISR